LEIENLILMEFVILSGELKPVFGCIIHVVTLPWHNGGHQRTPAFWAMLYVL
jgi:hypothetical protein